MVPIFVFSSFVALAAIALESERRSPLSPTPSLRQRIGSWLVKLLTLGRSRPSQAAVIQAAPVVTREPGWTFIRSDDLASFEEWLGRDEQGFPVDEGDPALGSHLLIELYGCPEPLLTRVSTVGEAMRNAADESEATTVATSFHEFEPYGVSGAVIIQESHYTIHTWPEHGYAAVDLFYCGGTIKVHRAIEVLQGRFQPSKMKFLVVRRGLKSEVGG